MEWQAGRCKEKSFAVFRGYTLTLVTLCYVMDNTEKGNWEREIDGGKDKLPITLSGLN